jgi:hypothetical protein
VSFDQRIRQVRQDIDNYNSTVDALVLFGHVLVWDDGKKAFRRGSSFSIGRRFKCSSTNGIHPDGEVTPDLAVVATSDYGILAEAKISFQGTPDSRRDDLRQLMKYDDDLSGWPTTSRKIARNDLVLLPHYTREGDVKILLEKASEEGKFVIQRKFAAISFVRFQQAGGEYMAFHIFYGSLSDSHLQERFKPLSVPFEKVRPLYSYKIYDVEPPLPLILTILWDQVLSDLVGIEKYKLGLKAQIDVECTVDQIVDYFSKAFAPTQGDPLDPKLPKRIWIKRALDFLAECKLAKSSDPNADQFVIQYRRKSSTLEYFIKRYAKWQSKQTRKRGRPALPGKRRSRRDRDHPSLPFPD